MTFVLPVRRPQIVVPVIEVKLKAGSTSGFRIKGRRTIAQLR
jgi:alpha-L-fucosidase